MSQKVMAYTERQEMRFPDFELQHKRDTYLNHVELHHHDFYEIYYLVSGDVTYVIEGKLCRVLPGDLLLVSPQELHQVSIGSDQGPYERYVFWISQSTLRKLSSPDSDLETVLDPLKPGHTNLIRLTSEQQFTVRNLMESVFQETESQRFGSDILRENYAANLLVQINRLAQLHAREPEEFVHSSPIVSNVVDYVNRHYRERLSLDTLAEQFYVSKYHLSHEFQKHMGTGIYRYIQKKRLQIARQLLAEGESPTNVSVLCGFGDYPGFYRAFTSEYGVSPRAFVQSVKTDD